ncbi:SMP-30/gluconolactonase/LRE family protein [Ameyamaea chiangmaiensis]|uniref:SMP-30/gluconolactonase/LRE family protein n=1 Tax=Ameyamaea chiangmaiensis TaxID=442969 RepID=A0A850PG54_9PROT|nr:L-dopachrome tautomerase-related protein [Ameyamaea chiangmaiensis]MBS4074744.1 SMP-30/gluconolactonase/LRE family protein [Ameyamaea chiangmaiensis]NVN40141.1 SMP-30/gluconolactonase/LRE family protein [Ameyamaea chiangmaiensis]
MKCVAGLAACLAAQSVPVGAHAADSVDKGAAPSGNVTVIGRFPDAQPSGIAVLPDGRLVLGFPRSAHDHAGPRLAVFGNGHLTPFPDAAQQAGFVSPLGMTVDAHGTLWVLDEGLLADKGTVPGAARLFAIDPKTNRVTRTIALEAPALRPDSHPNDVRVDVTHGASGTAFITDSSQTTHPALIVVDLATGHQRRILADAPCVMPKPGFLAVLDGRASRYDADHPTMAQAGANGIGLSADQTTLFWQPLTSRELYAAPTATLADPKASDAQILASVHDEGEAGMGDGEATAPDGTLYLTDIERHGILARHPDGSISVVAHDPRLVAPDGLTYAHGALYGTVGQWSRLPVFNGGHDLEERPWIVVRITLPRP